MRSRFLFQTSPLMTLRQEVDRLFHQFQPDLQSFQRWAHLPSHRYPPINLWEDNGNLCIEAELPGVSDDQIDLTVSGNELVLKGSRPEVNVPEGAAPLLTERRVPEFSRVIHLPCKIDHDKIEAAFENGILTVTMPKAAAARSRQIKVRPVAGAV